MLHNVGVMLFILALPVIFCLAMSVDPCGLKLAIVNHEMEYTNLTYQECDFEPGCYFRNLSCRYLHTLNSSTILKQYYPDPESAKMAVKKGDAWGALYFTENYTDALVARMALGTDADEETVDQSEVRVWLDMSDQQIGVNLQRDLKLAYQNFTKDLLGDCGMINLEFEVIAISFKESVSGTNQKNSSTRCSY